MDGSALEHSDSDSGESWTLLENSPAYADDALGFPDSPSRQGGNLTENIDRDEDTDGISIISDSDPESTTPCDSLHYEKCLLEENRPTEPQVPEYVSAKPLPSNITNDHHESMRSEDDFLGDSNGKLKTYVHRRNKRLSTMLNIIVLGSVITAAGVAIGHMWGAKNDCTLHTTPSVNKILSNLYKLQEENSYLRNKLKELTLLNNVHVQQRKGDAPKILSKQNRCKKVFEESLNSKNVEKLTKCVDNDNAEKTLENHLVDHEYEKEFLNDVNKLKNIYEQNKSWLDEEISKRMKNEEEYVKKSKQDLKSPKSIRINERKSLKEENLRRQLESINELPVTETVINVTELVQPLPIPNDESGVLPEKKITYADSLKSVHKIKRDNIEFSTNPYKNKAHNIRKRQLLKEDDAISMSDDEIRKDDRYVEHKFKADRKKNDRHKIHKKQKRRNKYEQWEMKGGYMKDYDDFSVSSSQDNEFVLKNPDKNFLSRDFERNNYINQFSESEDNTKSTEPLTSDRKGKGVNRMPKRDKTNGKDNKDNEGNWFEKRAALRNEARKKLEQELFGETTLNNAGWYFRRMQRREQCRVKGDNSTYRKLSKRIMNFKTKH